MRQKQSSTPDVEKKAKSETISELAHRHLHDKNHTTTDEEIRNAKLDFTDDVADLEVPGEELSKIDNNTVLSSDFSSTNEDVEDEKESKDDSIPNPYDILSS